MNIGIDHGYYAIKTRHCSFPAGKFILGGEVWRGGKAKSRSVPALPETERLKMGALVPSILDLVILLITLQFSDESLIL